MTRGCGDAETAAELSREFYHDKPVVQAENENQDAAPQVVRPAGADGFITPDQRRELYKLASRANVSHNDLVQWLSEHYQVDSTAKITPLAAEAAAAWLKSVAEMPIQESPIASAETIAE